MSYQKSTVDFGAISPFRLFIAYNTPKNFLIEEEPPSHIHDAFEIYFNISGSVSFMVENRTYPIASGDLIITKPFEYHHCIYHNNREHEHYCLQFSAKEGEGLFLPFFERKKGQNNHVRLRKDAVSSLRRHLDSLRNLDCSATVDKYYHFIRILQIIQTGYDVIEPQFSENIPENLRIALDRISLEYSEPITVETLASEIFVSVNTLERYFRQYLNITPSEYIKRKRLSEAMILLDGRLSVSQVAYRCGFSNTSNFIQIFKGAFGTTPYRYLKSRSKE